MREEKIERTNKAKVQKEAIFLQIGGYFPHEST